MNREELNKLFDEHFIDDCNEVYDAQNEIVDFAEKAVKLFAISDVMNSVLTELYNELSELNDMIKCVGSDNYEYYLGRIKGVESSIQIVEKHYS